MPLLLKGKSKARLEILWDGTVPGEIEIVCTHDPSISLFREKFETGRVNIELTQLDFSKLGGDVHEIELLASVQTEENSSPIFSEPLTIQKCHHPSCGQWGHAREDGYCKHCGRRIRDQNYTDAFAKLEAGEYRIILSNGVEGTLLKKKEIRESNEGVYSVGQYEDKQHPKEYVEILEERYDPELVERFSKLQNILKGSELLEKHWKLPFSCFQEDYQRIIWIYYPRFLKQQNWREISALSYISSSDVDLLTTRDIIKIGIQLCEIVKKIHQKGYNWGSLRLDDLIICRDKEKNVSIDLATKDIVWDKPISKKLLDGCLMPWELFWENNQETTFVEVTEVYIIAAVLYLLKAKAHNLLSYNSISYHYSLPSLKLFIPLLPEKKTLQRDTSSDYFESTINQALILDPQERGFQTLQEFQIALQCLLETPKSPILKRNYVFDIGESLDVGNEKREDDLSKNQDAIFASTFTLKKEKWGIFILCDGISTATIGSGDIASRIVINTFRNWWSTESEKERKEICRCASTNIERACKFLNEMVNQANRNVCEEVNKLAPKEVLEESLVMGSTITVGLIYENSMVYGWLGDSPIYRISQYGWERLNYEDNERNLRIHKGMPLEECFIEGGNALTRCIGAHFYIENHLEMHFGYANIYPGEYILVCSDGIPDYIEQEAAYAHHENYQMLRITSILREYETDTLLDAKSLATIMISVVNRVGGGYDNLSAILISTIPEPPVSFETSYQRLRSISPALRKLLKDSKLEWDR